MNKTKSLLEDLERASENGSIRERILTLLRLGINSDVRYTSDQRQVFEFTLIACAKYLHPEPGEDAYSISDEKERLLHIDVLQMLNFLNNCMPESSETAKTIA